MKGELIDHIYRYFNEVNTDSVVYHCKYRLKEIKPSKEVVGNTLSAKRLYWYPHLNS